MSGISTAKRSIRRASRSAAAVSRAIHFLRAMAASSGSDAAVAVRRRGDLHRLARSQALQHPMLHVLPFGRELPALPACASLRVILATSRGERVWTRISLFSGVAVDACGQNIAAQVGNAVVDGAPHFGHQRQHGAQHFAQRRQIILRRPLGQLQQMLAEQRLLVQHGLEIPHLELGRRFGTSSAVTTPISFSLRKGTITRAPRCGCWPGAPP